MNVRGSQLASVDHSRNNAFWSRTTVPGLDKIMADAGPTCEPVLYAAANPHWRIFTDYDYIDEKSMRRSAFYEMNEDYDIRYRMGIRLIDDPSISRALVLFWDKKRGHADRFQFEKAGQIVEQLRLSAHVSLAMGQDMKSEQLLVDNLSRSHSAALVTDPFGEILLMNTLAGDLLEQKDGICSIRQTLALSDRQRPYPLLNAAPAGRLSIGQCADVGRWFDARPTPLGSAALYRHGHALAPQGSVSWRCHGAGADCHS